LKAYTLIHILFAAASFTVGALPFGKWISSLVAHVDITKRGSGNIGATNVARELGIQWGIMTLTLDLIKGFVPVFIIGRVFPDWHLGPVLLGLCALTGHQFSVFLGFKGGKGVATALGVYLALAPFQALVGLCFFVVIVVLSDFVSLGSILSAWSLPILFVIAGKPALWVSASALMAGLISFRHKDNIRRLMRGEERRWRKRKWPGA